MTTHPRTRWRIACLCCAGLAACLAHPEPISSARSALTEPALLITEVAQATPFDGRVVDAVEVYCAAADGCEAFRVCDSSASGTTSCSSPQPALALAGRRVVTRGNALTSGDVVWLADAVGAELAGTRVSASDCASGSSHARSDCAAASWNACSTPNLGLSAGVCDAAPTFRTLFTENQHGQPEATCTRPVCQQLMAAINGASTSIDFAIYGVRAQPAVIEALLAAQTRGVRVRAVVDTENADCSAFGYPDTSALIAALTPGSVRCDIGPGYTYIMHDKFFVFDGQSVWTGSTNLSDTELGGEYNSDVAVLIDSPELAAVYDAEFEEMYGGKFHHKKVDDTPHQLTLADGTRVESYFSPSDGARAHAVLPLIAAATSTLDVAMFFFTDPDVAQALIDASARGVRVRMVLDASGAAHPASKSSQLCAADIPVKVENWGGKSHSKWAVADADHDAATVLFGSMNWTASGDQDNDENTLVVHDRALAAQFRAEFERQWADLPDALTCAHVQAESAASSQCGANHDCSNACSSGACCDGVDNDHDGLIDLQEEACGCNDGIDNDEDGFIDGDDFDCRSAPDDP
jgi:phosphatidylserine/phosphatidylglycerophosphate/cardiolipin synthase-like enzyme